MKYVYYIFGAVAFGVLWVLWLGKYLNTQILVEPNDLYNGFLQTEAGIESQIKAVPSGLFQFVETESLTGLLMDTEQAESSNRVYMPRWKTWLWFLNWKTWKGYHKFGYIDPKTQKYISY